MGTLFDYSVLDLKQQYKTSPQDQRETSAQHYSLRRSGGEGEMGHSYLLIVILYLLRDI